MLICYDKAFPEAARTLTLQGAQILTFLSAWPGSKTNPGARLEDDRQWRRAETLGSVAGGGELGDRGLGQPVRPVGSLRFHGGARIVAPGGDVVAASATGGGLALAAFDVTATLARARRALSPINDLQPDTSCEAAPLAAAQPTDARRRLRDPLARRLGRALLLAVAGGRRPGQPVCARYVGRARHDGG